MKTRKKELDVDFIGGTAPLTKEEEKKISEVIKMLKSKNSQTLKPARKLANKKKVTV